MAAPSPAAPPPDYSRLLITVRDLTTTENYTATTPTVPPGGQPGTTTTFSNRERTRVIVDSIQIFADPSAAGAALESAKASTDGYVHGVPEPAAVGTHGTTITGPSPDGTKSVTVLMFTEGTAFVELEFDGPPDALVPASFVTDVGERQDSAIRRGLNG
jgi:hypothetical protein